MDICIFKLIRQFLNNRIVIQLFHSLHINSSINPWSWSGLGIENRVFLGIRYLQNLGSINGLINNLPRFFELPHLSSILIKGEANATSNFFLIGIVHHI